MLQNEQGKWIWYNFISKGFLSLENALNTKRKLLYQFDVVFCCVHCQSLKVFADEERIEEDSGLLRYHTDIIGTEKMH